MNRIVIALITLCLVAALSCKPALPPPEVETLPKSEPRHVIEAKPKVEVEEVEDIVVEEKAESSLVEFVGVDPRSLTAEDFEKRSVHAMQRLGVSEVGVLGTFLRSLIRQGQRDVVIESLESLQDER